ncbi:MAG: amidophosphoribosyltransferase [Tissierellia bacterium]|nr:amidophosphoribosyltransferase [Tissierellia bacterium]
MSGNFAIFGNEKMDVSTIINVALYAIQHRGQICTGMTIFDYNNEIRDIKGQGLVSTVYNDREVKLLEGNKGVGHVKYAFSDEAYDPNFMPYIYTVDGNDIVISIEGNVPESNISPRVFVDLIRSDKETMLKGIPEIKGAYSAIYMDEDKMVGIRDPWGIKPLSLGIFNGAYMLSSETCAFDSVGGEFIRDIEPGEIIFIEKDKIHSYKVDEHKKALCIFEFVYIARQDSYIENKSVYEARYNMGKELYKECPTDGDIVIGAPDSGTIASLGYARESGIPFEQGIVKNRYIGRTFIEPTQEMREQSVKIKLTPLKTNIEGKRIILVDDSIVRGTTIKRIIKMLKEAGAKEVHVRVSSPPIRYSCDLSVDTPNEKKLISHGRTVEETREYIGADSLYFISKDSLKRVCGNLGFCTNCFDGNYPI